MLDQILELFGLNVRDYKIIVYGSGLINHTWKVCGPQNYILQQINVNVFKEPEHLAENLVLLKKYFKDNEPGYLFVAPIKSITEKYLVQSKEGNYYRLFPFIENSITLTEVRNPREAFEAAYQFGKFTCLLKGFDLQNLKYTLPRFHDLKLRFDQFKDACMNAPDDRLETAADIIKDIYWRQQILFTYQEIVANQKLPLRVIHHDTKISNILFDKNGSGLCVIDLDTVMPGYYLSDTGDMLRTYLSPSNEEETDFSKIQINEDCFYAIYKGYLSAMQTTLTDTEKEYFIYSGKYMIYMQAIRFLTDFLNGDIYYHTTYPHQNLMRAQNQVTLLTRFIAMEDRFQNFIQSIKREIFVD